ncbi:MAG: GxxExxY protein [Alphaproteobacteria bacterium]|nr:GxxExxY protein [Alphaproteobacteria bacterium]
MIVTTESTKITEIPTEDLNSLSGRILDCAIQVHKKLGPGLLESAYQHGLAYLFSKNEISFIQEKPISILIDDFPINAGYRADFIIDGRIILEIKSVEKLMPIHQAQLLTYMKLGGFELGLLLNFNEQLLKNGIKRMRL